MNNFNITFGDILTAGDGIICQGVNCQAVMGSGLAKHILSVYPGLYDEYKIFSNSLDINDRLGKVHFYSPNDRHLIANCFTQFNFGRDKSIRYVNYKALQECFVEVVDTANFLGKNIHFPLIGAGLANGNWAIISQIISNELKNLKVNLNATLWLDE